MRIKRLESSIGLATALIGFLLCYSCCSNHSKLQIANPLGSVIVDWSDAIWTGDAYRKNGEWEGDWEVRVTGGDSITIIKWHNADNETPLITNTEVYQGRLIQISNNELALRNCRSVSAWGCSKPFGAYLYSDSVPIYIDSEIYPIFKGGVLDGSSQAGNSIYLPVDSTVCIIRALAPDNTEDLTDYYVTLTAKDPNSFVPLKFMTGSRCAAHIRPNKYFDPTSLRLHKNGHDLNLVWEKKKWKHKEIYYDTIKLTKSPFSM